MALVKRFLIMVLAGSSAKGQTAAVMAIVATGFQEVVLRAFMPKMDHALNRWMGRPPIVGAARELQRLGWVAEINIARQNFAEHFHTLGLRVRGHRTLDSSYQISAPLY